MPDISSIHCVQKCLWIKYLTEACEKKWKVLRYQLLGLKPEMLDFKPPEASLKVAKTNFYQQVLDCWSLIKIREPTSVNKVLNEYIPGLDISSGPAARVCRKFDRAAIVH